MTQQPECTSIVRDKEVRILPLTVEEAIHSSDLGGRGVGDFAVDLIQRHGIDLEEKDVLVVSSKVATIYEGGQILLADVVPCRKARVLGRMFHKDPRKVQLVLEQGRVFLVVPLKRITRISSMRRMLERRSPDPDAMWRGFEKTNNYAFVVRKFAAYIDEAGIDHTNSPDGYVTVLPSDPCATAGRIRDAVKRATGREVAVIITDTVTMAGRLGSQDVAIGYAGIDPITRATFSKDLFGVPRSGGIDLVIDSIAGIAGLVMGQTIERTPAALVRGLDYAPQRDDEMPGMAAVAYPAGSEVRIALLTLVATLRLYVAQLISCQRGCTRPRRKAVRS